MAEEINVKKKLKLLKNKLKRNKAVELELGIVIELLERMHKKADKGKTLDVDEDVGETKKTLKRKRQENREIEKGIELLERMHKKKAARTGSGQGKTKTLDVVDDDDGGGGRRKRVTDEGLIKQGYCVVDSAKRFLLLYSFLKMNSTKKVMVFFSSCNSVKFYSELLRYNQVDCMDIHRNQTIIKKGTTLSDFCEAQKGILLCSDAAAREFDIPVVDWIVQYDPPDDPDEYIRSVGRTQGGKGNALLFLTPEEKGFVDQFKKDGVKEYGFGNKFLKDMLQSRLEKLNVFDVDQLDREAVAASFCLSSPRNVNLHADNNNAAKFRKKMRSRR